MIPIYPIGTWLPRIEPRNLLEHWWCIHPPVMCVVHVPDNPFKAASGQPRLEHSGSALETQVLKSNAGYKISSDPSTGVSPQVRGNGGLVSQSPKIKSAAKHGPMAPHTPKKVLAGTVPRQVQAFQEDAEHLRRLGEGISAPNYFRHEESSASQFFVSPCHSTPLKCVPEALNNLYIVTNLTMMMLWFSGRPPM